MKLVDLHPNWIRGRWLDAQGVEQFAEGRSGMGLLFDCPVHGEACPLAVWFENPVDGLPKVTRSGRDGKSWWQREGETFEVLTLAPSIHVQDPQPDGSLRTHWHGWIRSGEVSNA